MQKQNEDYSKTISECVKNGNRGKDLPLNKDGTVNDLLLFKQHYGVDLSKKSVLVDDLPKWE